MKAICIKTNGWLKNPEDRRPLKGPVFGEKVTVIGEGDNWYWPTYIIAEYLTNEYGNKTYWPQAAFIPVSEIDEMELHKQLTKAI